MKTVSFPTEVYKTTTGLLPSEFAPDTPLLVCLTRFLVDKLPLFFLGISEKTEQAYKYKLSPFEINFLATVSDDEAEYYFAKKFYTVSYDFDLFFSYSNHSGIVELSSEFVFKDTLEKSYFEVKVSIETEKSVPFVADLSSLPKFLIEVALADFADKILHRINKKIFKHPQNIGSDTAAGLISSVNSLFLFKIQLPPLCVDVFHVICHFYVYKRNKLNQIFVTADEILNIKNRKPNKHSNGKTYGYTNKMRKEIESALVKLCDIGAVAILAKDNYRYALMLRPQFFTKDKFMVDLPVKILSYNQKTCLWERKLSELLYTFSDKNSLKVKYFLELVKRDISSLKPAQIRDRLENTLDRIVSDNLISSWHYKSINEEKLSGKDWLARYKNLSVEFKLT